MFSLETTGKLFFTFKFNEMGICSNTGLDMESVPFYGHMVSRIRNWAW